MSATTTSATSVSEFNSLIKKRVGEELNLHTSEYRFSDRNNDSGSYRISKINRVSVISGYKLDKSDSIRTHFIFTPENFEKKLKAFAKKVNERVAEIAELKAQEQSDKSIESARIESDNKAVIGELVQQGFVKTEYLKFKSYVTIIDGVPYDYVFDTTHKAGISINLNKGTVEGGNRTFSIKDYKKALEAANILKNALEAIKAL